MSGAIEYGCQVLKGTNKTGILKPNERGNYEMIVGALNMTNSKGEYYDYASGKKFFDEASDLVRMAGKGVLKAEEGHPVQETGMDDDSFIERLLRVEEKNVCALHKRIWLDHDRFRDDNGRPFIGIMSEISPSGYYGPALEKSLEKEGEEVCFSIRCFSFPRRVGGRVIKEMRHVVTFDRVTEPGILYATKFHTPTLECHSSRLFTRGSVQRTHRNIKARPGSNESAALPVEALMSAMGWEVRDTPQARRNFFELMHTSKL